LRKQVVIAAVGLLLTGCTGLPSGGPATRSIIEGGIVSEQQSQFDYNVVKVDRSVVSVLEASQPRGFAGTFGKVNKGGVGSSTIGVGDTIAISIYESAPGGLFGTTDALGNGSKSVTLPQQQVDISGKITVPYAGRIKAAGRTPDAVQKSIVAALQKQAIEPQAIITVTQNGSRFVTVSGEVGQGGRFPLSARGDRILDAIGQAGGPKGPAHQTYVRLTRADRTGVMRLKELVSNPEQNVGIAPGDQVFLFKDPKRLTFLGATARNASVEMQTEDIMLSEALGQANGLLDDRSDPKGIFVFRLEKASVLRELGLDAPQDGVAPVVYNIDFSTAQGIFLSQAFPVQDKDVVYISNAPTTDLQKFMILLNSGLSAVNSGAGTRALLRN
jgi:polysaccharide biosynthesis/export protein